MDKKKRSFRVDAHQHFWVYNQKEYKWIDVSMVKLQRDFLPPHLNKELKRNGIDFCITVQARQTLQETKWLLELAQNNSFIKGIVGWVDLKSNSVERDLEQFTAYTKFKGVRHVLQDEKDDRYMLNSDFKKGISQLEIFGPNRLLFGSDWPVCKVAAKYKQVLGIVNNFISSLSPVAQACIMGQNAIDFYNLEV